MLAVLAVRPLASEDDMRGSCYDETLARILRRVAVGSRGLVPIYPAPRMGRQDFAANKWCRFADLSSVLCMLSQQADRVRESRAEGSLACEARDP